MNNSTPSESPAPARPVSKLFGPCGHGSGPCGTTPTRPYACGPRCEQHSPTALTQLVDHDHNNDQGEAMDPNRASKTKDGGQ